MFQTFLNILGVIGIVAVAAFVIVFLSDLFISIVDGTNGIFFKRNKNKNRDDDDDDDVQTKRPILLNEPKEYKEEKVEKVEKVEERTFERKAETASKTLPGVVKQLNLISNFKGAWKSKWKFYWSFKI